MRIIADFKCDSCDLVIEDFVHHEVREQSCSCGGVQKRMISTPRVKLEGVSGDFPSASYKWDKIHSTKGKYRSRHS